MGKYNVVSKLIIGTGKSNCGLGDTLLLTPICRQKKCVVQLSPKVERFTCLFQNLAEVEIVEDPVRTSMQGCGHIAMRMLRALGLNHKDYIPQINVPNVDLTQHLDVLKDVVVVPNCCSRWKHIREMPENWDHLLKRTKISFCQFGISDNCTFLGGQTKLDIPLDVLAAIYHRSGKYIGVDTGDSHLMLAVGGKCIILHPPNGKSYQPNSWHYESDRVRYINFKDWEMIDENYVSNFFGRING
jgi:hypothetical protein